MSSDAREDSGIERAKNDGTRSAVMESAKSETAGVVAVWLASRILILAVAVAGYVIALSRQVTASSVFEMWDHFESPMYADIARNGYVGEGDFRYNTAYFPATAVFMRMGLFVGLEPALTGMMISLVAGAFAAVALGRLTAAIGGAPMWGAIGWVAAPTVVFLTAPWSEALFSAFAFWSWLLARQGRWWWSGVLAAGASFTRINGVFLVIGLFAVWWFSDQRRLRSLVPLGLPFLILIGHSTYLWSLTGRWNEWRAVQSERWGRELVDPFTAFTNSWNLIFDFVPGEISTRFIGEIAAVLFVTLAIVVLLVKRMWPEAVFVAVTLVALATSTYYYSIPRNVTLLFPIWMLLGLALTRHVWLRWLYLALSIPLTAVVTVLFVDGQWIS